MPFDLILYLLLIVAVLIAMYAQIKVSLTYRRYSSVPAGAGKSASVVARELLDGAGLTSVQIERVSGSLTDHFDPSSNILRLSDSTYDNGSAAAVGVAAHEVGHAIQHAEGYLPIIIRGKLVPVTNFASRASWIFILIGAILAAFAGAAGEFGMYILYAGILLFAVTTLFQLVTLPCEFNASHRALVRLRETGEYSNKELAGARKVLSAAALTYVAALAVSLLQLLRLIAMFAGNRNNRR